MREVWRYVSAAGIAQQAFEITIASDLFADPSVSVHAVADNESREVAEHNFTTTADAYRFAEGLRAELESRGLIRLAPGGDERAAGDFDSANALDRLALLLSILQPSAEQWSSEETARKIRKLMDIVGRIRGQRRPVDELQLELFDDDFTVIQSAYELAGDIAAVLFDTLMPYQAKAKALSRFLQNPADSSGSMVTRLIDDRRDALQWSLYAVFGRDVRTSDVIRRFARRRIMTLDDLIRLSERAAFSIARTDAPTWFKMCKEIAALGFGFGYRGEKVVTYSKFTQQRRQTTAG